MATKPLIHLYFALDYDTNKFIGWDVVDKDTLSKYQYMLGDRCTRVFVIELRFPGKPMYEWIPKSGWEACKNQSIDCLPKDVQMKLLTEAF